MALERAAKGWTQRYIMRAQSEHTMRSKFRLTGISALLAMLLSMNAPAHAQRHQSDQWVKLGEQDIGFGVDRETIQLGRDAGRFRAVKLKVLKHAVVIRRLRITSANNETEDVAVPRELAGGRESPRIDLRGGERFIERIELDYQTKLNFKGDAIVEVYGLK